ncbi:hypothetical protein D3C84_399290 [compost metagenome]
MADAGACRAEAGDFVGVEVNAVGEPGAGAEPADAVQVIHGTQAETLQAEVFFVEGFGQVGVQAHVEPVRHFGAGGHDFGGDRERRARRQGDLDLRAFTALVVFGDQALAVGEDDFTFLHGLLRRQAPVLFTEAHRAPGQHGAHAQFAHAVDLHVDGVFQAIGKQVMVVGGRGTPRQQQFGQGYLGRQREFFRGQSGPDRVEGFQPREQRLVDHRCPGAGQGLIEMVVGVDQPRQDHVLAGIEDLCAGSGRLLALLEYFDDHAVLQHQAATGIEVVGREDGERVF